nr:reverse transcriptase domain-containing protein [Tanacetum cinerariifolium]
KNGKQARPAGFYFAEEDLQSGVKKKDFVTNVKNTVLDFRVMKPFCFLLLSSDQSLNVLGPSRPCAPIQQEDDKLFRKPTYMKEFCDQGHVVPAEKQILYGCKTLFLGRPFCLKFVLIKSSEGVYLARKPLRSSRLAIMDPQEVEVSNRGLKCILERAVGENCASWSDKIDDALWAFHTAYKTPIRCTSYKLVYGKACHLPVELEHKAYWALKHSNFDLKTAGDHRKVQINELNELRDQAYENSLIYKEKTKRLHDSKIKNRVFNIGDKVLLFNSRLKIFFGKVKSRWSGLFTIFKVYPYDTV